MKPHDRFDAVTITLNPAIDRTLTICNFAAGAVNRVEQMHDNPGGKGVNVAAMLADYGHRVAVTGFLGRENPVEFERMFAQKGIVDLFVRIDGQTRTGIKIADPARLETTDINFPGLAPSASEREALFAQVAKLAATDCQWFVLSGSLPPGLDSATYRDLIAILKSQGRKVVLDASGEAFKRGLEASPQIVKPNIHELEALVDKPLQTQAAIVAVARELLRSGVELVVVSMGEKGALFVNKDSVVTAIPPRVEAKSTVGAGDAMVAGIIAAQLRGQSLAESARLATAFSLERLTHSGKIDSWLKEVSLFSS